METHSLFSISKGLPRKLLRGGIHFLLLRYRPTLEKVYLSRWGQALFAAGGPLSAPVLWIRKNFKRLANHNSVLKLPALLKLGFTEKAIKDLEKIAAESTSLEERANAAWELAVWFVNSPTRHDAQKTLGWLDLVLACEKSGSLLVRASVLKGECLLRVGSIQQARQFVEQALARHPSNDLYLALANVYAAADAESAQRLKCINHVLADYGLEEIALLDPARGFGLDNIHAPACKKGRKSEGPLVTVIMPAFNAEDCIHTALRSLLDQTWQNLEILVVDDCSSDKTRDVVSRFAAHDPRVRLLVNQENSGPYVARNLALREARGEFVTCHDADDWSHPGKIETQVKHLLANEKYVANLSRQARVLPSLVFYRRGNAGYYTSINFSSFMFRRRPAMEKAGFWDSVRFGADSEYLRRLKKIFGENAVADLPTGPLTFMRQTEQSLTGGSYFGYPGFFMGARKAYLEALTCWHRQADDLYVEFPLTERRFPIPGPMEPGFGRNGKKVRRHFDVVIATEFRLTGGTVASTIEEIKAQRSLGLQTGLVHLARFDLNPATPWNGKMLDQVDGRNVHLLVYGEEVSCDLLIIRHPPILQEFQLFLPKVKAKKIAVIVNQSPLRDYGDPSSRLYDPASCQRNIERYFDAPATWYPIGPAVRAALLQEPGVQEVIELSAEDWSNIIDVDQWRSPRRFAAGEKPVIGRHSRDQYVKWPREREELVAAYPDDDDFIVKILGGAETPEKMLGRIPKNWIVSPYDEVHPRDFLAGIDVFVYFTHPEMVEAFGRTPLEAMAAGVPVILPEKFKPLFRGAAIYATPFEVKDLVLRLHRDQEFYAGQAEQGVQFVRENFGYGLHRRRLAAHIGH